MRKIFCINRCENPVNRAVVNFVLIMFILVHSLHSFKVCCYPSGHMVLYKGNLYWIFLFACYRKVLDFINQVSYLFHQQPQRKPILTNREYVRLTGVLLNRLSGSTLEEYTELDSLAYNHATAF